MLCCHERFNVLCWMTCNQRGSCWSIVRQPGPIILCVVWNGETTCASQNVGTKICARTVGAPTDFPKPSCLTRPQELQIPSRRGQSCQFRGPLSRELCIFSGRVPEAFHTSFHRIGWQCAHVPTMLFRGSVNDSNAIGCRDDELVSNAPCCPSANRRGISASLCSPPSP